MKGDLSSDKTTREVCMSLTDISGHRSGLCRPGRRTSRLRLANFLYGTIKSSIWTDPLCEPLVPVTVMVYVPLVVLLPAEAVTSNVPVPPFVNAMLFELNDTLGACLTLGVTAKVIETAPEKPLILDSVTVEFALSPFAMTMRLPTVLVPIVNVGVGARV